MISIVALAPCSKLDEPISGMLCIVLIHVVVNLQGAESRILSAHLFIHEAAIILQLLHILPMNML